MIHRILVVNPGSTSTRIGLFENEASAHLENIFHPAADLSGFDRIIDQKEFRAGLIRSFLEERKIGLDTLHAVVGRGGLLRPIPGGTYRVDSALRHDLEVGVQGEHASNLGGLLAFELASPGGIPAFIVDPVVVDELEDAARISGIPEIPRRSIFHALNQKACARQAAVDLGRDYTVCNRIVAHLGGGISGGAHRRWRVVEVNNALDGEGPITPERAGTVPAGDLVELALSGKYSRMELKKRLTGRGGLVAHLGTNDMREVEKRMAEGDGHSRKVFEAMALSVARRIGACAAVLAGEVDAVVLTGGLAHSAAFISAVRRSIEFLGRVIVIPGEDEMTALAMGALRVLRGEEEAKTYRFPD